MRSEWSFMAIRPLLNKVASICRTCTHHKQRHAHPLTRLAPKFSVSFRENVSASTMTMTTNYDDKHFILILSSLSPSSPFSFRLSLLSLLYLYVCIITCIYLAFNCLFNAFRCLHTHSRARAREFISLLLILAMPESPSSHICCVFMLSLIVWCVCVCGTRDYRHTKMRNKCFIFIPSDIEIEREKKQTVELIKFIQNMYCSDLTHVQSHIIIFMSAVIARSWTLFHRLSLPLWISFIIDFDSKLIRV